MDNNNTSVVYLVYHDTSGSRLPEGVFNDLGEATRYISQRADRMLSVKPFRVSKLDSEGRLVAVAG